MNKAVWSYPKLKKDVPLGPNLIGAVVVWPELIQSVGIYQNFSSIETFLTSPKFEWSSLNLLKFHYVVKIYPNGFDFTQIWIKLL